MRKGTPPGAPTGAAGAAVPGVVPSRGRPTQAAAATSSDMNDSRGELEDGRSTADTPPSPVLSPTDVKLEALKERVAVEDLALRLLLPAAAECLIADFLPAATTEAGIDLASTFANTLGAWLEGLLYGVERQSGSRSTQILCSQTRTYFMNVFTSFPFVAVHAAEMCVLNGPLMGVGYALTSLALAVAAFELGRRPTEAALSEAKFNPMHWTWRAGTDRVRQRILAALGAIVVASLLKSRVELGRAAMGFGDAGAAAALQEHTFETLVGIAFAIAGAVLGGSISSCLRANFLSCAFVGVAYGARRVLGWDATAEGSRWGIVFTKFVGSFCGAMSGFASMLSDYGKLMHHELRTRDAAADLVGNIAIAMLWMFVFYAFDRHGLDVSSHAYVS